MLLRPVADALSPLQARRIWLAQTDGRILASWSPDNDPATDADFAPLFQRWLLNSSGVDFGAVESAPGSLLFWTSGRFRDGASGILAGMIDVGEQRPSDVQAWLSERRLWLLSTCELSLHAFQTRTETIGGRVSPPAATSTMTDFDRAVQEEVDRRTRELSEQALRLKEANRRMKRDLEAAAKVQQALLPTSLPKVKGAQFAWLFRPCEELGGDSLNVLRLDEHCIGLYILDVSGHGVQAALLSVTLSRLLSPIIEQSTLLKRRIGGPPWYELVPPTEVAQQLNDRFQMDTSISQYFTFQYAMLDPQKRTVRYVSAGHPGPAYLPNDGPARILTTPGFPIGCIPSAEYQEATIHLQPGERMYFYSDGLTEAANDKGELFGKKQLLSALGAARSLPLDQSVRSLETAVMDWSAQGVPGDDLTLLAVGIEEST
jgi:sigma-B regulation protein RsbU (phosphoserine phosphatase)